MTDTKEELICPACGEKMTKVLTKEGINIDVCTEGCGGIWFDNRELAKFDEPHENAEEILNSLNEKTFSKVNDNTVRICPVCKTKMVKNKYSVDTDIEIDECYNCGGKFLDNNELNQIRNSKQPTDEQINSLINNIYRTNNHTNYVSKNKNSMLNFFRTMYHRYSK